MYNYSFHETVILSSNTDEIFQSFINKSDDLFNIIINEYY